MNPPSIPTRVQDIMARSTTSVKGVLADFPTPILPNIGGEPTREALINLHQLVSGNVASVAPNLREFRHGHLALIMTAEEYMSQWATCLCLHTTQAITHQQWEPPKSKRSELKSFDKTKRSLEDTPLWTEPQKIKPSRRWNQYSCTHWWTS